MATVSDRPAGQLLDTLGVTLDYGDTDLVPDVVVVAKVIDEYGDVSIGIGSSESLTWVDQIGMLTAATSLPCAR